MKYFQDITDLEQAKKQYRRLAMQLHPDKGGSALEFQQMQQEYKAFLFDLHKRQNTVEHHYSKQTDILEELGKLAKVLIEKQVPQKYLKKKIMNSQSVLKKGLLSEIVNFLDNL